MRAPTRPLVAVLLGVTVLIAACGGTTSSRSPSPTTSETGAGTAPSSVPAPASPSPSPSPRTVTVTDVLVALGRPAFSFDSTVTGQITVNGVTFPMTGSLAMAHGDASNDVAVQLPSGEQRMSTLRVGGVTWTRVGANGPWVEQPPAAGGDDLPHTIATLSSLTDRGTTDLDGKAVHRFETGPLTAADLSITTPGITDFRGTLALLVDDDATVKAIDLTASYRQPVSGRTQPVTLSFRCTATGRTPEIEKPPEPWKQFISKNGYSIAYPGAMTAIPATKTTPDTLGYSATDFVGLGREPQKKTAELADYAAAYALSWKSLRGVKPESMVEATMSGQPAIVMSFHVTLTEPEYVIAGVTVKGKNGYFVALATSPGNEDNANSLFQQMLATYELTP